jgi:oxygen-independent coproporphyrinogen III oxidase
LSAANELGLYVHVPFCATTCDFCAFYQEKPERGDFDRYLGGIERELDLTGHSLPVKTVFWGGGTPGLLPPPQIRRLGEIIARGMTGRPAEWTVEMTPSCVKAERLEALKEIGVTRISMGAQSFQPRLLDALGRKHPRDRIFSAFDLLRQHGFENINLDLMFALPGQTLEEWRADMAEAIALGPEHLSTYCLTFEEDTALYVKMSEGKVRIDEEKEVAFYREAWTKLAEAGLGQYEISNYARPGFDCAHNINTWRMQEWLGLGPGAASQYRGERASNPASLDVWLDLLKEGERATEQRQVLSDRLLASDYLIFGLRLNAGVDLAACRERFPLGTPPGLPGLIERLEAAGLATIEQERVTLTGEGRLVVDRIGSELLEVFDDD